MEEKLKAAIVDALDAKLGYYRQPDGTFECEIYADYRDEMTYTPRQYIAILLDCYKRLKRTPRHYVSISNSP